MDALPPDFRASFERIVGLIETFGLEWIQAPYIKHLQGRMWEMRLSGRDGIARALYVTATGKQVVVLRVFVKTPPREIALALKHAGEIG